MTTLIKLPDFDPLVNYFQEKEYPVQKNPSAFIAKFNRDDTLSEEISIYFSNGNYFIIINNKLISTNLIFFKNFTFRDSLKIIEGKYTATMSSISSTIEFLDFYFYFRDMSFDLKRISNKRRKKIKWVIYNYPAFEQLFYKTYNKEKEKNSKKVIEIKELPQISIETGKRYLSKIKKLISKIRRKDVFLPLPIMRKNESLPSRLSFYYNSGNVDLLFTLFDSCIKIPKINKKTFSKNSELSFILSYLDYYNLFDDFYFNLMKEILTRHINNL